MAGGFEHKLGGHLSGVRLVRKSQTGSKYVFAMFIELMIVSQVQYPSPFKDDRLGECMNMIKGSSGVVVRVEIDSNKKICGEGWTSAFGDIVKEELFDCVLEGRWVLVIEDAGLFE